MSQMMPQINFIFNVRGTTTGNKGHCGMPFVDFVLMVDHEGQNSKRIQKKGCTACLQNRLKREVDDKRK